MIPSTAPSADLPVLTITVTSRELFMEYRQAMTEFTVSSRSDDDVMRKLVELADGGNVHAANDLATLYQGKVVDIGGCGNIFRRDEYPIHAFQYMKKSYELNPNSCLSAVRLGRMYCQGYGTEKNLSVGLPIMIEGIRLAADGLSRDTLTSDYLLFIDSWCNQVKKYMAEALPVPVAQPGQTAAPVNQTLNLG